MKIGYYGVICTEMLLLKKGKSAVQCRSQKQIYSFYEGVLTILFDIKIQFTCKRHAEEFVFFFRSTIWPIFYT